MLALILMLFGGSPVGPDIELVAIADGLDFPVAVRHAPGDDGRLFVVQQNGLIRILSGGTIQAEPFLDLTGLTAASGERGLLGLAFHPGFATNGRLFVNYTDNPESSLDFDTVIAEYRVAAPGAAEADPATATEILRFGQDFPNHNGGDLAFGPDGYLYIATGDGGDGGDPNDRAQDPGSLLGKLLRIDVDNPGANPAGACAAVSHYGIPADNPFRTDGTTCSEIAALGLRNPFRFGFDADTGDLFLGDVGQNRVEEIDLLPVAELAAGVNFGWDCREGDTDYPLGAGDPGIDSARCPELEAGGMLRDPIIAYSSESSRCSVTGGYRYRGPIGALQGIYFFGDFCTGEIFAATEASGNWSFMTAGTVGNVSGFGEGRGRELLIVDYSGSIIALTEPAIFRSGFEAGESPPARN